MNLQKSLILIVDDRMDIVRLFELMLKQFGFSVIFARNGEEGLSVLQAANPKPVLILSNYLMPTMDGLTFLQRVRQQPEWNATPFVLTSGNLSPIVSLQAMEHGADGLLAKPFRLTDLKAVLATLLPHPV